jgi:putative spermidine/putrescine transport system permease protein
MKKDFWIFIKLTPLVLPFVFLFLFGIFITIAQSFGFFVFSYKYQDLLFAYRKLFSDLWFIKSFVFSIYIAFFSSIISVILGTLISYLIRGLPNRLQKYTIFYKIPLILPHIAAAYIIILLLSSSGFFSSLLYNLHLIKSVQEFPKILYSSTGLDIIAAYIFKETPFVILLVLSVMNKINRQELDSARMLGAGKRLIFTRIVLPHIFPVAGTTFIILFIYSFGAFDIPYVIGESYPGMLSLRIYSIYFNRGLEERPVAMAMLSIIFLFSLLFIYIYSKAISKLNISDRKL